MKVITLSPSPCPLENQPNKKYEANISLTIRYLLCIDLLASTDNHYL